MEIEIKRQNLENVETEIENEEEENDKRSPGFYAEFGKKWEIATSRLKPFLATPQQKRQMQKFKRTSHSFVYLGGIRNVGDTEIHSNGK